MVRVDLQVDYAGATPSVHDFNRWAAAAVRSERSSAELCIVVVDHTQGRDLNQRWRQRDYATNVLAFPADLPPELNQPLLGDLVICAPVVIREAREQEKTVEAHWAHLTVHGTLHLLGYDHLDDASEQQMESLETDILSSLGFADPYQPSPHFDIVTDNA